MLDDDKDEGVLTVKIVTANPLDVAEHPAGVVTVKLYVPEAVAV